jgi:hypothetical protein
VIAIVSPAPGSQVAGTVQVVASTTLESVSFVASNWLGDEIVLAEVPVVEGQAAFDWSTWGWPDGLRSIKATGCPTECATTASVQVVVGNVDPALSGPGPGVHSGPLTFTATAPEGAVLFRIGRARVYDDAAPYTATVSSTVLIPDGARTVTVQRCWTPSWCGDSASTQVTVKNLHPSFVTGTQWFSPDGDGVQDAAALRFRLPERQSVRVSVVSATGEVVRGPVALGSLAAGIRSWTWRGRDDAGRVVPEGDYTVRLSSRAGPLYGAADSSQVFVDVTAPRVLDATGPAAFYPVRDGYRDLLAVHGDIRDALWSPRTAALVVRDAHGRVVHRSVRRLGGEGVMSMTWDGRLASGALAPTGTYTWRLSGTDPAGNTGYGPARPVRLSHLRTVERTFVVSVPAASAAIASTAPCAAAVASSFGPGGVDLRSDCDVEVSGPASVEAAYRVAVPKAVQYLGLRADVYARTRTTGAYYAWVSPDGVTRIIRHGTAAARASWQRFAEGSGLIRADGTVLLGLGVQAGTTARDLDAQSLRLTVYARVAA